MVELWQQQPAPSPRHLPWSMHRHPMLVEPNVSTQVPHSAPMEVCRLTLSHDVVRPIHDLNHPEVWIQANGHDTVSFRRTRTLSKLNCSIAKPTSDHFARHSFRLQRRETSAIQSKPAKTRPHQNPQMGIYFPKKKGGCLLQSSYCGLLWASGTVPRLQKSLPTS